jgi:hypothetical protein
MSIMDDHQRNPKYSRSICVVVTFTIEAIYRHLDYVVDFVVKRNFGLTTSCWTNG